MTQATGDESCDRITIDIASVMDHPKLKTRPYRKLFRLLEAPPQSGRVLIYPRHYRALVRRAWREVVGHDDHSGKAPNPEYVTLQFGATQINQFKEVL